jgi:hypothetical protein
MLQAVDQARPCRIAAALQDKGKEPRRAAEVAGPEFMAWAFGKGGMKHLCDLRLILQPPRDLQATLFMALQPNAQGAKAASREKRIVGADMLAERAARVGEVPPML